MSTKKQASLMISLPKETKLALRKIAAEKNLDNPDKVTSAAAIARTIILNHMAVNGLLKPGNHQT